jgi:hypothetical protein
MAWFKRSSRFVILAFLAMALTLVSAVNVPAQMPPQSSFTSLGSELAQAFRAPMPPGSSTPDNREGGATRGGCISIPNDQSPKVIALVPRFGMGETVAENPTVFWYVPKLHPEKVLAPVVELALRDVNDQPVYKTQYPLTKSVDGVVGAPGIMSLTIANAYPLKIGQEYKWQLAVICNYQEPNGPDYSENPPVEGIIKRVEPDPNLELRVQQASPEERVALYAKANLWYEMLDTLIKLRRDRPYDANLADAWEKLFTAVGLDKIAQEPVFQGATKINNLGLTN